MNRPTHFPNRLQKTLVWLLVGIFSSILLTLPVAPIRAQTYSDLNGHWAQPCIQQLSEANIVSGYPDGSFRPNQGVTRAEYAALVNQAFPNIQPGRGMAGFQDVSSDYWAYSAIQSAYRKGFLSGYPGQEFRPDALINRTEAFVALASGLNFSPPDDAAALLENTFVDAPAIPNYSTGAIAAGTAKGILISPYPVEPGAIMNPTRPASRAQVAAALCQAKFTESGVPDRHLVNPGSLANSEITLRLGPVCTNSAAGYRVRYPVGWMTNSGETARQCRYFDPEALTLPERSETFDEAISLRRDSIPYDQVTDDEDITQTVLTRRSATISGRPATITEAETTGRGILPGGIRSYSYVVDLDEDILVGSTYAMEGQAYARNQQVLDWMMASLEITR